MPIIMVNGKGNTQVNTGKSQSKLECISISTRPPPPANMFMPCYNLCTTCHKLQGCTVESILVNPRIYAANWAYVVLSRVKTLGGLYIREPLTTELFKHTMPQRVLDMISAFRQNLSLADIWDAEYERLVHATHSPMSPEHA